MLDHIGSLIFKPDGIAGLSDEFLLNLTTEGVGIVVSAVLITVAIRVVQFTSWWLSVRGPRARIMGDTHADAKFTLRRIRHIADSSDAASVRRELRLYSRVMVSMAKRLEVARDLFAPKDAPLIVAFITDAHTVAAIIEDDCELDPLPLPLSASPKTFPGRDNRTIRTSASNYYTQMFFALDQLFVRQGLTPMGVERGYEPDFVIYLQGG